MAGSGPAMTAVGGAPLRNNGTPLRSTPSNRRIRVARFLKRGMDASAIKAADAKVRETVESILAQVDEKKDLAIRELSKKFDNWEPRDFRLSPAEIEQAISQVSKRDLDDIKFAQAQVR